jgi:S1-C subfamily serine protease
MQKNLMPLIFILLLSIVIPGCAEEQETSADDTVPESTATQDAEIAHERENAIVAATRRAAPAVVTITTITRYTERVYDPWSGFFNDPFFREFFGHGYEPSEPQYREREIPGMGSGFIIDEQGHVLTAEHVVHSADELEITLPDGRSFPGEIVGRDPYTDTAVVRIIDGADLPIVDFGDSDALEVGQWAIAIGNPFGFVVNDPQPSVTVGVVSAVGRTMRSRLSSGEGRIIDGLIQTDAAINPGNSGGPLVNSLGRVIGINSSILSTSGGNQGIGFAIPINTAREVAGELIAHGNVSRAYIGFYLQDVTASIAQALGLDSTTGAIVTEVDEGSPADEVGLRRGDVILGFNDEPITCLQDFYDEFQRSAPGDELLLKVLRDGRLYKVSLVVDEQPVEE